MRFATALFMLLTFGLDCRATDLEWWREARFGLFVHWGPVSLVGTEIGWSRAGERRGRGGTGTIPVEVYDNLYKRFDPVKFDANQWVRLAKQAGMKYVVFTTKHHDGFCMFDSALTDYKITNSPFGRDIVGELAAACHAQGMKLGFYYSQPDWRHPDYRGENHSKYVEYLHGQVRELCTNYGKVDILWFDGLGGQPQDWEAEKLFAMIRGLQPGILINNRAGIPGDFDTPEQRVGQFQNDRPWESCITICHQWAWKPNDALKSFDECIRTLVGCAGGDGNLLLNVGPMPDGRIEPRQADRLREMGRWLERYGESIYGTRGGPFEPWPGGACTQRGNRIYLHLLGWKGGTLDLPAIERKILGWKLLTGGAAELVQGARGIEIAIDGVPEGVPDTILELELDGPAATIAALPATPASGSLATGKAASASNHYRSRSYYSPAKAVDDDPLSRWATDRELRSAWLEVDLGQVREFGRVAILEHGSHVQAFSLEVPDGAGWKSLCDGKKIGPRLELDFKPTTARKVRLHIRQASGAPSIAEFQLFPPSRYHGEPLAVQQVPALKGSRNDSPSLAVAADGTLWVAWSAMIEGRYRLCVARRENGVWAQPEQPVSLPCDHLAPRMVITETGAPGVVFEACRGAESEICFVFRTQAGWSDPLVRGRGRRPAMVHAGGAAYLAYESGPEVLVASNAGREIHIAPRAPFECCSNPQLAAGHGGAVWLAWCETMRTYQAVRLRRIDLPGQPVLTVDRGCDVNRDPRLSVDGEGRAWIVYEELRRDRDGHLSPPAYVMEQEYEVTKPSLALVVTDGEHWWHPLPPPDPAHGLVPSVHCARSGQVLVLGRRYRAFDPICEVLGPDGWRNLRDAWGQRLGYKAALPTAEAPDGSLWTAWAQHEREWRGSRAVPSWTWMDGPDHIVVAELPRLESAGPPLLRRGEKVARGPWPERHPSPPAEPRGAVEYGGQRLELFFGDLHQHSEFSRCGRTNGWVEQNHHYSRYVRRLDFLCTIDHSEHLNDHNWRTLQLTALRCSEPGRFIAFDGFEWTSEFDGGGNLFRGHYNAIFRDPGTDERYFSASAPETNTPLELWRALRECTGGAERVLTFGHHPSRRMAWLSWAYYDPEMAPLFEIAQSRGSYESEGCFAGLDTANDSTRVHGHYARDGLARGMRFGFIAGGDHGGRDLAAVYAPELTREALFAALRARRTYATSGARILLDVRVDGHFMGEEYAREAGERRFEIRAEGTARITQVDLVRNGRVVRQWFPSRADFQVSQTDAEPLLARENSYYVRVLQADGEQAWSSPVWLVRRDVQGELRFQVGGDELHVLYPGEERDVCVLMHNEGEDAVKGLVELHVPQGWKLAEAEGIAVDCPPGGWRHAVFHVTPPALEAIELPEVTALFEGSDRRLRTSKLFVVASPKPLSREQKAVLMDARAELPRERFPEYLRRVSAGW